MIKRFLGVGETARRTQVVADGETLASELEKLGGYRVLRALDAEAGVESLPNPAPGERIGAVVDCETTGLDPVQDRMIELAAQRFSFDAVGRITAIEKVRSWLEDPQRLMPERLSLLTGLTDAALAGRAFDDIAIVNLLENCDLIVAHNAGFDRPFFDRRFPVLRESRWACSLSQIDWLSLGFDGRALGHLLLQSGLYFDGHRAANDVCALTKLIERKLPEGRTILSHLLDACAVDNVRFEAVGAPFEAKDLLKQRGYRWEGAGRLWWREVADANATEEAEWLNCNVYFGRGGPRKRLITALNRFAETN